MNRWIAFLSLLLCQAAVAQTEVTDAAVEKSSKTNRPAVTPDFREDDIDLKLQKGDFLVIPIPFSNPTLDSGLVLGAAYFHAQTEEEKAQQPASVTGGAAMYSSNESLAYGIGHQQYWDEDRWRFSGAFGEADLNLRVFATRRLVAGCWMPGSSIPIYPE